MFISLSFIFPQALSNSLITFLFFSSLPERRVWIEKSTVFEEKIKELMVQLDEMKLNHAKEKAHLEELLSHQTAQVIEEWKLKVEALTESLSEEQKNRDTLLSDSKALQEEMETLKISKSELEQHLTSQHSYPPHDKQKTFIDVEVQVFIESDTKEEFVMESRGTNTESIGPVPSSDGDDADIENLKMQYDKEIETMRIEHKKEFENAARKREEKFQTELRYFLKEKEEKAKCEFAKCLKEEKENIIADCMSKITKAQTENDKEINRLKCELERLQQDTLQSADLSEKDSRLSESQSEHFLAKEKELLKLEQDLKEERESLKREMEEGKKSFVKKIEEIERGKKEEIEAMVENHRLELKSLEENLKEDLEKERRSIEDKLINHARQVSPSDNKILEEDSKEVERVINKRLEEERARWFKDAQNYYLSEINNAVKQNTEELQKKYEADMLALSKKHKDDAETELKSRVTKLLEEEKQKMKDEEGVRELEREKIFEGRVKIKVQFEVENLKIKFLSELDSRVEKEKKRMEEELKLWKEDAKRKIEKEKENFAVTMKQDMEKKLTDEKQVVAKQKEEELKIMREEFEGKLKRQIENERQRLAAGLDLRKADFIESGELADLKDRLQSEVDARTKVGIGLVLLCFFCLSLPSGFG